MILHIDSRSTKMHSMAAELQDPSSQRLVDQLAARLRRRQVVGSRDAALQTVVVLRQVVAKASFSNIDQLVAIIRLVGRRLVAAQPKEHTVGNTVRKVLHHIREEYNTATKGTAFASAASRSGFSMSKFVMQGQLRKQQSFAKPEGTAISLMENDPDDPDAFAKGLKPVLMEAIQDVLDELETVYDNVSRSAREHIHSDEIILTLGFSKTVQEFLKSASHNRNFTVIVAASGSSDSGRQTATSLSASGIPTFLVPDSSIYAIMSRVNKLIIGAHAILANGGLFAVSGSLIAATAAQAHRTPVVVVAGQFKLTPLWNLYHDTSALDYGDPAGVLGFDEGELISSGVEVVNPYYDYVQPELVDAFITNDGEHPPSSIYRLIKETYDDEDHEL